MPRATHKKILVADTPEELEDVLRRIAVSGTQKPSVDDPLKTQVNIAPPRRPGERDPHEDPTPEPDGDPLDPDEEEDDPENPEVDPATLPPSDRPPEPTTAPEPTAPQATAQLQKYQSRIHVVEAWKYPGSLKEHPSFVDPGWVAWAEYDEATKQESGPALRVPTGRLAQDKLARKGDYIVRQLVTIDPEILPEETLDVWPAAQFERLFIPTPVHN